MIKSFREYVEKLQACGEIVTVEKEVDWNLEMSAITRHAYDLPAPAPLFTNVKGCTPGFRVLGAPVGLSPDREHPFRRVAIPDQYIFPLVAYLSQEEKKDAVSTRVIYNCLTPFHTWPEGRRPVEASFRGYPEELQKKVLDNWKEYGF